MSRAPCVPLLGRIRRKKQRKRKRKHEQERLGEERRMIQGKETLLAHRNPFTAAWQDTFVVNQLLLRPLAGFRES